MAALSPAVAQDGEPVSRWTVWDLELGRHAWELPRGEFFEFACGTNGGPPSLPLAGWAEYGRCPPERETGRREVYFRYDDEPEYWARAHNLETRIAMYQGTRAYDIPVIVSGLFDGNGFLIGIRVASDSRTDASASFADDRSRRGELALPPGLRPSRTGRTPLPWVRDGRCGARAP